MSKHLTKNITKALLPLMMQHTKSSCPSKALQVHNKLPGGASESVGQAKHVEFAIWAKMTENFPGVQFVQLASPASALYMPAGRAVHEPPLLPATARRDPTSVSGKLLGFLGTFPRQYQPLGTERSSRAELPCGALRH